MSTTAPEWDLLSRFDELEAAYDRLVGEINAATRRLTEGELSTDQYRPLWIDLSRRLADVTREQRRDSRAPWVVLRDAQYTVSQVGNASSTLPEEVVLSLGAGLAEMSLGWDQPAEVRRDVARCMKEWIDALGLAAEGAPAGDRYRKLVAAADALIGDRA